MSQSNPTSKTASEPDRWGREGRGFDRIVSSPLARARTTAELISAAFPAPMDVDPLWLERNSPGAKR